MLRHEAGSGRPDDSQMFSFSVCRSAGKSWQRKFVMWSLVPALVGNIMLFILPQTLKVLQISEIARKPQLQQSTSVRAELSVFCEGLPLTADAEV